jgi:hypothetical protein
LRINFVSNPCQHAAAADAFAAAAAFAVYDATMPRQTQTKIAPGAQLHSDWSPWLLLACNQQQYHHFQQ